MRGCDGGTWWRRRSGWRCSGCWLRCSRSECGVERDGAASRRRSRRLAELRSARRRTRIACPRSRNRRPSGAAGTSGDDARVQSAGPAPRGALPDPIGRDVVRTAQLTLQVADPTAAARGVRTAVAAAGGVVAEEQVDATGAWLVVRVPAAGLDRLVDDLAATGTVLGPVRPHRGRHRAGRRPRQPGRHPAGQRHAGAGAARPGDVDRRHRGGGVGAGPPRGRPRLAATPPRRPQGPGRALHADRRAAHRARPRLRRLRRPASVPGWVPGGPG